MHGNRIICWDYPPSHRPNKCQKPYNSKSHKLIFHQPQIHSLSFLYQNSLMPESSLEFWRHCGERHRLHCPNLLLSGGTITEMWRYLNVHLVALLEAVCGSCKRCRKLALRFVFLSSVYRLSCEFARAQTVGLVSLCPFEWL